MQVCADLTAEILLSRPGLPVGRPPTFTKQNPKSNKLTDKRLVNSPLMDVPDAAASAHSNQEESKGNQEGTHTAPVHSAGASLQQEQLAGSRFLVNSLIQRQHVNEQGYGSMGANTRAPTLSSPATLAQNRQLELQQRLLAMRATSLNMPSSFLGAGGVANSVQASMIQRLMLEEQQRNRALAQAHQMQSNALLSNDINLQLQARALLGSGLVGGNESRNLIGLPNSTLGLGQLASQGETLQNLQGSALPPLLGLSNSASSAASSLRAPASLSSDSATPGANSPVPPTGNTNSAGTTEDNKKSPPRPRKRKAREAPSTSPAPNAPTSPSYTMAVHCVPHHSERPYSPLGTEEDENWLSSFQVCLIGVCH